MKGGATEEGQPHLSDTRSGILEHHKITPNQRADVWVMLQGGV